MSKKKYRDIPRYSHINVYEKQMKSSFSKMMKEMSVGVVSMMKKYIDDKKG